MADGSFPPNLARNNAIVGFAGGGGSSVAFKLATGCDPDLAMNHWLTAVLAHQRHFPLTEHHCADIFDVDPRSWRPGERIAFGWFSPDCTDFSKAKGKAPRSERIRGLAWSVIPWARFRAIDVIMLENVEEFEQWGPVYRAPHPKAGEPIAERRGETFARWRRRLTLMGYAVEWRVLNAADYGAPTTRKRLYVIARRDGKPIVWPQRTHAPRQSCAALGLKPWRGACEIIDWSQDCPSIFLTPEEVDALRKATGKRVQRPLVAATQKRIARGLERYVIASAEPFIVPITHAGDYRAHGVREPLRTITSVKGGEFAAVDPTVAMMSNIHTSNTRGGRGDPRDPTKTQAGALHAGVVTGTLVGLAHGEHAERAGSRTRDVRDPVQTVSAGGGDAALMAGSLVRTNFHSAAARNGIRDAEEPMATSTGDGGIGLMGATLVPRYGERPASFRCLACGERFADPHATEVGGLAPAECPRCGEEDRIEIVPGQSPRALDVEEPLPTAVPTGNQGSITAASLVRQMGKSTAADVELPAPTGMPGGGGKTMLSAAHLVRQFGSSVGGRDVEEPHPTVMPGKGGVGGGKTQLVSAVMAQGNGDRLGRSIEEPVTTLTERSTQQQLVSAHLDTYYSSGKVGGDAGEPMRAATGQDHSLIATWLEQANTGMTGHPVTSPMSTIVAGGGPDCRWGPTQRLVEARLEQDGGAIGRRARVLEFLWAHFGLPTQAEWDAPAATLEARKKFGLVLIARGILAGRAVVAPEGAPDPTHDVWMIVDIGLRMLLPKELAAAMGLPPEYDLTVNAHGDPISKTHQTQMIGNMVSPPPAAAMIAANCPDLCQPEERRAA